MDEDAELGEHVYVDVANRYFALDVVGLEKARPILQGYLGAEWLTGMIEALRNRNEVADLIHQHRLMLARSTTSCLRKIRDKKSLNDATISAETLDSICEDAAEELRRRSIPMIVVRLARHACNAAKKGVKDWLFITRSSDTLRLG